MEGVLTVWLIKGNRDPRCEGRKQIERRWALRIRRVEGGVSYKRRLDK